VQMLQGFSGERRGRLVDEMREVEAMGQIYEDNCALASCDGKSY
jgi:hypothetical protein